MMNKCINGVFRFNRVCRPFIVFNVVSEKKEWFDTTHEQKTAKKRKYVRPEDIKEYKKKQEQAYHEEDYKNRLLGARVVEREQIVENDYIFGTSLPGMLDLTKSIPAEMYMNYKHQDYDRLIDM